MAIGSIDMIINGQVHGWLFAEGPATRPYVTVDGLPARLTQIHGPRPDVEEALGITGSFGYAAALPASFAGPVTIRLYAVDSERVRLVQEQTIEVFHNHGFSARDLAEAVKVSRQPDSVAIVVWDAAHNPAGRAKVLYDIVSSKRPAVLFGFCHAEFGDTLWPPLEASPIRSVLVRPASFGRFSDEVRGLGLSFDTIWVCKPRLPSFALAEVIANPDSAMILDIDDNEEAFSRGPHSWARWYGESSVNKAALYRDRLPVRSVASASLQERFGGEIVRHVRKVLPPMERPPRGEDGAPPVDLSLVFIGTVRPHKGMLEAARAIRMAAYRGGLKLKLTVGGTFNPLSLEQDLHDNAVETMGLVPAAELPDVLSRFDAVLAGYPGQGGIDDINTYQISSKVGDALQSGLPVLIPRSPATADLAAIPGVYLFDVDDFGEVLARVAAERDVRPTLPESFSIDAAYETFLRLEAAARDGVRRWPVPARKPATGSNIVILWKQGDSGLFGRRVDQIARLMAERIEGARVRVLEFDTPAAITPHDLNPTSAEILSAGESRRKVDGVIRDGVEYRTVIAQKGVPEPGRTHVNFTEAFDLFLQNHDISPANTVMIVFPLHYLDGVFEELLPCLARFETLVDVVDNQLSWTAPTRRAQMISLYRWACDMAHAVVFNSAANRDAMIAAGIVDEARAELIPNWYLPPAETDPGHELWQSGTERTPQVLYSGDLNNRIDWDLFDTVCALVGARGGMVHIVGASERVQKELTHILRRPDCIYHGAMREEAVLGLAASCDFAVVPHVHDGVSAFMNPLKIMMYVAAGLPHVVTAVPGLDTSSALTMVAEDNDAFLDHTRALLAVMEGERPRQPRMMAVPEDAARYCFLVAEAFGRVAETYGPAVRAEPCGQGSDEYRLEDGSGEARIRLAAQ